MPTSVIATVNELAAAEGMKGLRMKTKSGHILYDSAWIAGVDYADDEDEDNADDDNDDDQGNIAVILANHDPIQAEPNARGEEEEPPIDDDADNEEAAAEVNAGQEPEEEELEAEEEPPPPP